MRANLTLQSSAFRHAIRLTLCLAIGEAAAHLLRHPRSYWLAMTIVIVLKQEFAATLNRGMLRILGTIIGLIFATLLFHVLPPGIATRREFRIFATDVDRTLRALMDTLRSGAGNLPDLPDLRDDHHRLLESSASEISRYALVNEETDRMTNSLNTLAEQVAHWIRLRQQLS